MFLQLNANETETKGALRAHDPEHHPEGEGLGSAIVYRKDPKFDEMGVDDMVLMKQLNDAELANNLRVILPLSLPPSLQRCSDTVYAHRPSSS